MKSIDKLIQMDDYERVEYLYKEAEKLGKRLNPEMTKYLKFLNEINQLLKIELKG